MKVFLKIDLVSRFHQIAMEEESRELTAFRLPSPVEGCVRSHLRAPTESRPLLIPRSTTLLMLLEMTFREVFEILN